MKMAHREPGQHHRPPRATCLRLDNLKLAIDPLHGPTHVKLPRSEVDVIPPQRQQLTAAKTGHQRQDVQSLEPLAADHLEQALSSATSRPTRRWRSIGGAFTCVATFLVTSSIR
jgi:hypothetical protein